MENFILKADNIKGIMIPLNSPLFSLFTLGFTQNALRSSVLSFVIFILSFLLTTCSTSTNSDKQVVFSGTVTLEGETDFSGVTVSLYNMVELDTTLVRINQEYPNMPIFII